MIKFRGLCSAHGTVTPQNRDGIGFFQRICGNQVAADAGQYRRSEQIQSAQTADQYNRGIAKDPFFTCSHDPPEDHVQRALSPTCAIHRARARLCCRPTISHHNEMSNIELLHGSPAFGGMRAGKSYSLNL